LLFNILTIPEKLSGKYNLNEDGRIDVEQVEKSGTGFMLKVLIHYTLKTESNYSKLF